MFSWSGQVSCFPWGAGTGFCNFSVIHGNSWNSHNIMEFLEISLKIRNSSKFSEFCISEAIHPPESLIFLRNYRCFRDPAIFTEISIFIKKVRICAKIIDFAFSPFSAKSHIWRKMGPGAPKDLQKGWNSIRFIRPGASGPRGTKKCERLRKPRKIFCVFAGMPDFHVKSWKFLEISISHFPKPLRKPMV